MAGIQWASHLSPAVTGQSWVSLHAFGATKEKAGSPAAGMVVAAPASGATAKNGRGYGDGTPPSAQDDPPGGTRDIAAPMGARRRKPQRPFGTVQLPRPTLHVLLPTAPEPA